MELQTIVGIILCIIVVASIYYIALYERTDKEAKRIRDEIESLNIAYGGDWYYDSDDEIYRDYFTDRTTESIREEK